MMIRVSVLLLVVCVFCVCFQLGDMVKCKVKFQKWRKKNPKCIQVCKKTPCRKCDRNTGKCMDCPKSEKCVVEKVVKGMVTTPKMVPVEALVTTLKMVEDMFTTPKMVVVEEIVTTPKMVTVEDMVTTPKMVTVEDMVTTPKMVVVEEIVTTPKMVTVEDMVTTPKMVTVEDFVTTPKMVVEEDMVTTPKLMAVPPVTETIVEDLVGKTVVEVGRSTDRSTSVAVFTTEIAVELVESTIVETTEDKKGRPTSTVSPITLAVDVDNDDGQSTQIWSDDSDVSEGWTTQEIRHMTGDSTLHQDPAITTNVKHYGTSGKATSSTVQTVSGGNMVSSDSLSVAEMDISTMSDTSTTMSLEVRESTVFDIESTRLPSEEVWIISTTLKAETPSSWSSSDTEVTTVEPNQASVGTGVEEIHNNTTVTLHQNDADFNRTVTPRLRKSTASSKADVNAILLYVIYSLVGVCGVLVCLTLFYLGWSIHKRRQSRRSWRHSKKTGTIISAKSPKLARVSMSGHHGDVSNDKKKNGPFMYNDTPGAVQYAADVEDPKMTADVRKVKDTQDRGQGHNTGIAMDTLEPAENSTFTNTARME